MVAYCKSAVVFLQVKPAEIVNIEFVKPKHATKRRCPATQHTVQSKLANFTGPSDSPKTQKTDWTNVLYDLVPNACMYTILPRTDSPEPVSVPVCAPLQPVCHLLCHPAPL